MQLYVIFSLILAILAVIFALQNADQTFVQILVWKFRSSLALVMLVSLAAGALISALASLPTLLRDKLTIRSQKKKVAELETSLAETKKKLDELQARLEPAAPPSSTTNETQTGPREVKLYQRPE